MAKAARAKRAEVASWPGFVFVLFSFLAKMVARAAICFMSKTDVDDFPFQILQRASDTGSDSEWSVVSTDEENSEQEVPPPRRTPFRKRVCRHIHRTKQGSNGSERRVSCTDCGEILLRMPTQAAIEKKARKARAAQTCGVVNSDR